MMANEGVSGRVIDEDDRGIRGLVVGAYDVGLFGERLLGNTANVSDSIFSQYGRTGPDGRFSISYPSGKYDLIVRVYDTVKRKLGMSSVHEDVSERTFTLPFDILIRREVVNGHVAKEGTFMHAIGGNRVEALVDNKKAWGAILESVRGAKQSIDWMLFYLDVNWVLMTFDPDPPTLGQQAQGVKLEEALKTAGIRGVKIRLACNQLWVVHEQQHILWPLTTAAQIADAMRGVPNVEVRALLAHVTAPIHAKFVVIDNEVAYVIGSPFVSDYYDDTAHMIDDSRRGSFSMQPIESRQIRLPVHDVSLRLRGPAIGQLSETFLLHWNAARLDLPQDTPPPAPPPEPQGNDTLQVVRTLAGNELFKELTHGESSIVESYLRAIGQATTYIYLENQYFTCDEIAEALVLKLKQAPDVQVIFLTNNKVDIPGYKWWQPRTIQRVVDGLTEQERKRIGFFTTWSHDPAAAQGGRTTICRNYVHSKVAIIDDNWVTVGSANLDGASLTYSQPAVLNMRGIGAFVAYLGLRGSFEENRMSETNLTMFDGIAGASATGWAATLRKLLWAEHLGYKAQGVPDPNASNLNATPAGGWLSLWNERAAAKLANLQQDPIALHDAKILRFPYTDDNPRIPLDADSAGRFLKYAGVDVDKLVIREHFRRYRWRTGTWVDD